MTASLTEPMAQSGILADRLVGLAGTPDDSSDIATDLIVIAQLAAARVSAVDAASVTGRNLDIPTTMAASGDLAVVIDKAQYMGSAGPCLQALETGRPVAVTAVAAATAWPGFRQTAQKLGVRTSLSIPLFTGSGNVVASLNLYSFYPHAFATLSAAIGNAFDPEAGLGWNPDDLDGGGRELVAGMFGALALRRMIQQAIQVFTRGVEGSADDAYRRLRARAADTGASLIDTAAHVIGDDQ